jgi:hypothetical protein
MLTFEAMLAVGSGWTLMVMEPESGWLQLGVPDEAALTSAIVVVDE